MITDVWITRIPTYTYMQGLTMEQVQVLQAVLSIQEQ